MKNKYKLIKLISVSLVIYMTSAYSFANTVISDTLAIQGAAGNDGLIGTFWSLPEGSTGFNIKDSLNQRDSHTPSGKFISSSINYGGNDQSSINQFLQNDSSSYISLDGINHSMSDAVLEMKGFIEILSPSTINFILSHDDSAQLIIGNKTLISANCCGTDNANATFTKSGFYAIDIVYSNTKFGNHEGGANIFLDVNGNRLSQSVSAVPEPGTYATVLPALGLMGFMRRRRKTS